MPTKDPISFNPPAGKVCIWLMACASAAEQVVSIKDSEGKEVVHQRGKARPLAYTAHGKFVSDGNGYTVQLLKGTSQGETPERMIRADTSHQWGGSQKSHTLAVSGEDWKDNDYNDCYLTVTWFASGD